MKNLESQNLNCMGCAGTCCTYEANSMLMTPVETEELFTYLKNNDLLTDELKASLEACMKEYRLEPKYQTRGRSYLRKSYTCPFFQGKELGCPLPREVKPYGCLAFNSHHETLKSSQHCYSDTKILLKREETSQDEEQMNAKLRSEHNIIWEKAPIPNALLELWNK